MRAGTVTTLARWVRYGLWAILLGLAPLTALAAPYAAIVQDARTGEILYSKNADTRLHPASLTKMLTLYIAFEAIERGEISLDSMVTISRNAAAQPPSRLGLKAGQKIALRHLIRAAAIKSANDAASAIGDAISGDEAAFAARMNRTAKALGMKNSSFRNANGLTREGHLSTAHDMNILGRRLFYDFPQYYNIFSRRTADAGMAKVANTNRRFLDAYEGADGIKTGFTNAAGFNLTASAQRGGKRIIATVFGGTSTAQRNAKMAELMDIGFSRAPSRGDEKKPAAPQYLADAAPQGGAGASAKTIRLVAAPASSPRPKARPGARPDPVQEADAIALALASAQAAVVAATAEAAVVAAQAEIAAAEPEAAPQVEVALAEVAVAEAAPAAVPAPPPRPEAILAAASSAVDTPDAPIAEEIAADITLAATPPAEAAEPVAPQIRIATADTPRPMAAPRAAPTPAAPTPAVAPVVADAGGFVQDTEPQPETLALAEAVLTEDFDESLSEGDAQPSGPVFAQSTMPQPETLALASAPAVRTETMILAALTPPAPAPREEPVVVARVSSSGGRHWGVSLGKYNSHFHAERALLTTALMETASLGDALRKVANRKGGFEANFVGMSKDGAELACARLTARGTSCTVFGP
nr:D-alanyl-D-alanine carboxypeptidase family protein [Phaeovulum sp. NW3]